jgi:hypothetical protein
MFWLKEGLMAWPNSHHLESRVNQIYDHLYANAASRTPAGISTEVGKVLHTGMFLEECKKQSPAFSYDRNRVRSLVAQEAASCRLVAGIVRQAFAEMNARWKLYGQAAEINLNDLNVAYTVAQLSGIHLSDPKRDVFGDVVEVIRSNWAKRVGGQFFTDQRVTSLAMTLLCFDPRQGDDLVDICAGTGGFLLAGVNHIRSLLEVNQSGGPTEEALVQLSVASIKGLEVDEGIADLANASLKARLGTKSESFVSTCDSLDLSALKRNGAGVKLGTHLCAATNPPFGTKITVKDPAILRNFDLAMTHSSLEPSLLDGVGKLGPRALDILFLEQNVRLLAPGRGRLAIVMPYQILSGPQTLFVREWLLRQVKVVAVVDLPSDTFQPHTGTKTALLVVKRRAQPLSGSREDKQGIVFMAMPRWVGHDRRGHPVFRRNADGTSSQEILSDFDEVKEAYRAFLEGENPASVYDRCFKVAYSAITRDNLLRINALFHKPLAGDGRGVADLSREVRPGWRKTKLREVVKRIFCPGRFRREYVDRSPAAVPFLGGSNITELVPTTEKWLRADDPKLEALRVKLGWLLITRSGSTGIVSSVPPAWDGCAMSEHVIRIVPDPSKLDPYYILAFLRTNYAQEIIKRGVFGSVIDEITPEFLGDIDVPIPESKSTLKAISEKVKQSEAARQTAIEGLVEAVEQLNYQLGSA